MSFTSQYLAEHEYYNPRVLLGPTKKQIGAIIYEYITLPCFFFLFQSYKTEQKRAQSSTVKSLQSIVKGSVVFAIKTKTGMRVFSPFDWRHLKRVTLRHVFIGFRTEDARFVLHISSYAKKNQNNRD